MPSGSSGESGLHSSSRARWKSGQGRRPKSWFDSRGKEEFSDRLVLADRFESSFIHGFNQAGLEKQIIKRGIETDNLSAYHGHLRFRHDPTTLFLRYAPDSVLIDLATENPIPTTMLEFKAGNSGIYSQRLFQTLQRGAEATAFPLTRIEDVFNVERDALIQYRRLAKIGARIVILVYAGFRDEGDRMFAQYVDRITGCGTYNPNTRGENVGSGTLSVNVNLASMEPAASFFERELAVPPEVVLGINDAMSVI